MPMAKIDTDPFLVIYNDKDCSDKETEPVLDDRNQDGSGRHLGKATWIMSSPSMDT